MINRELQELGMLRRLRETFGGWDSVDASFDAAAGLLGEYIVTLRMKAPRRPRDFDKMEERMAPRPLVRRAPSGVRFHGRIVGQR